MYPGKSKDLTPLVPDPACACGRWQLKFSDCLRKIQGSAAFGRYVLGQQ